LREGWGGWIGVKNLGEGLLEEVMIGMLLRGVPDHVLEQQLVSRDSLDGHDQARLHSDIHQLVKLLLKTNRSEPKGWRYER
jgi:hypothetical protein